MKKQGLYTLFGTLSIVCLLPLTIYAQDIKVKGQVTNQAHEAVEAAVVMLVRTHDARPLEYCITDKQGFFSLKHGKKVAGQLLVRHVAYAVATIPLPEACDTVLDVVLTPAQYEMEEVNIKGKRIPVQFKNGDWVINVENFITPGTERCIDLMKNLPGMMVNEETGQIKLHDKPVELKLNGVRQPLTFDLLKSLPSRIVDQVVLTPIKRPEHDDPDNNAAIVDIRTKKKYIDGFTGNIDGSYGKDRANNLPGDADGDFFVMLMKKDFYLNLKLNGSVYSETSHITDSTWYGLSQSGTMLRQDVRNKNEWSSVNNLNLSWNVKNGNRINANLYLSASRLSPTLTGNEYRQGQEKIEYDRHNTDKRFMPTGNIQFEASENLPFKLKASYGYIRNDADSRYDYQYRRADTVFDAYDYFYKLSGSQNLFNLNAGKPFLDNKLRIDITGHANIARTHNDIRYEPVAAFRTNENFEYKERIGSGYLSLSYYCNPKISVTAGIQAAYTNYHLQLAKENLESANHYWNLLPWFSVNFNISKNYTSTFHFNSTIKRPSYNMLTPNVIYASDKFYSTGNPWLKPAKKWSVEYFNTLFTKFSMSAYWGYTKDLYSSVLIDKGNEVTESSYRNCFDKWETALNFNSSLNFMDNRLNMYINLEWIFGKYLNFKENFTLPKNRYNSLSGAMNFDYWITGNYRLKAYGNMELGIIDKDYQSDTKPYLHFNLGVRYKCLAKRSLYVSFYGTDIFNSSHRRKTMRYDQNIRYLKQEDSYQGLTISLSYSFQGGKDLKRGEVDDDVNAENYRFDK